MYIIFVSIAFIVGKTIPTPPFLITEKFFDVICLENIQSDRF